VQALQCFVQAAFPRCLCKLSKQAILAVDSGRVRLVSTRCTAPRSAARAIGNGRRSRVARGGNRIADAEEAPQQLPRQFYGGDRVGAAEINSEDPRASPLPESGVFLMRAGSLLIYFYFTCRARSARRT